MSNTKSSRTKNILTFIFSGLVILGALYILFNKQNVLDQLSVWSYQPSQTVETISERVAFTDKGKFIFYATKPVVEDQKSFNEGCPRQEAGSPILGCYTTNDTIYIYDVQNKQLDGMEEVTAAHEMLHAVWARTSDADRSALATKLEQAYARIDDAQLKDRMDYYQRTEPGEFTNELHSILGTEISSLDSSLENYYAQFFDRQKVLNLHQKYSSVYQALYNRSDVLYSSMESLASSIESKSAQYKVDAEQLSADITSFNERANNNGFSSQSQFRAERAALVARSAALEADREVINKEIETYNTYYAEYQTISKQIEVLNQSIDSFKQIDEAPSV